jgi:hypothetical protein
MEGDAMNITQILKDLSAAEMKEDEKYRGEDYWDSFYEGYHLGYITALEDVKKMVEDGDDPAV